MKSYHISKYLKYLFSCLMLLAVILQQSSCEKYLDVKPDKTLVTPSTIQDLQGILDYYSYMNLRYSEGGEVASDDYYITDKSFLALPADYCRNAYLWKAGAFRPLGANDWEMEYVVVYNANIVLDNIDNIKRNSVHATGWDYCKGSALLFRGRAFYDIAQIWAKAYDSTTAQTVQGIPLRLTSDFNTPTVRATLQDTYNQIIHDLKASIPLLPDKSTHPYRPSKPAAYGFLARTYLAMRNYGKAFLYADSCLQITNSLCDYNNLDLTAAYPFAGLQFTNPEDIMHTVPGFSYDLYYPYAKIDTLLYASYNPNDLRKTAFFKANPDGSFYFRGSYDGNISNYNGLATDEMYLVRAECYARKGNVQAAMGDLNTLLIKRWKTGTFTPYNASDVTEALNIILTERRKELVFRTLRFTDLKRLNKEGANITLKRIINGRTYILPPNDPRYALPIPDNVINYTHIPQN